MSEETDSPSENTGEPLGEKEVFLRALEIEDLDERASWLRSACGNDEELHRRVASLLDSSGGDSLLNPDPGLLAQAFDELAETEKPHPSLGTAVTYFGDYELLDEVARGAMGVVFRARQTSLNRIVAVKMIRGSLLSSEADVRRFQAEAESAASLNHSNIVPIYEVGEHDSQHYFSMKLVEGGTLADHLAELGKSPRQGARLIATVARAVHHAHQHGILHRDLKPGNILLDESREPHITDFGLAKQLGSESSLTVSGQIMGTPFYMAPEQAAGEARNLSTAADVYSLGAILFEVLAGSPPFKGPSLLETIRQVAEDDIPRLSSKVPEGRIDRDLETIVSKCLQKNPGARYASASALAEDLECWLEGRPISARPVPLAERAFKWVRRKPIPAALAAITGLFLLTLTIGGPVIAYQQKKLKDDALVARVNESEARALAEERSATIRSNLYVAEMNLAQQALDQAAGLESIEELVRRWVPRPGEEDLRGWEWHYLHSLSHRHETQSRDHNSQVAALAWSPGGRYFASAGYDQSIVVRDLNSDAPPLRIGSLGAPLNAVSFHPSAPVLAVGAGAEGERAHPRVPGAIHLFDPDSGELLETIDTEGRAAYAIAWNPTGTRLASGQSDGRLVIRDWESGEEILIHPGHNGNLYSLAWHPQGNRIASVDQRGKICVVDLENGGKTVFELQENPSHPQAINAVSWSPDGSRLATGGRDRYVNIWDAESGERIARLAGHDHWISWVKWSPDGTQLASGGMDRTTQLWDGSSYRRIGMIRGHTGQSMSGAWHPDPHSELLATGGGRSWVMTWITKKALGPWTFPNQGEAITSLAWNSDGSRLVSGGENGTTRIWDSESGEELDRFKELGGPVTDIGWSHDGKRLLTASNLGHHSIAIRTTESGETRKIKYRESVYSATWHPSEDYFATRDKEGVVFRDGEAGDVIQSFGSIHPRDRPQFSWSPDGTHLAMVTGQIRIWRISDNTLVFEQRSPSRPSLDVSWSPDGQRLAIAGKDSTLFVVHPFQNIEHLVFSGHHGHVNSLSWSPDGSRLVSGGLDSFCRIWDTSNGKLLLNLEAHEGEVNAVAWHPDGQQFASAGHDGTVRIWDARRGYAKKHRPPRSIDRDSLASFRSSDPGIENATVDRSMASSAEPSPKPAEPYQSLPPESHHGNLHAFGVFRNGKTVDISQADGIEDIVAISTASDTWAAVRSNGEVLSNNRWLRGQTNVAQISLIPGASQVLYRDGSIGSNPSDPLLPRGIENGSALATTVSHGLVLRDDGTVTPWGERFVLRGGSGSPPELRNAAAIATTWGSDNTQAFVLHRDGTLSTWGEPELNLKLPRDLPPLQSIEAGWNHLLWLSRDGRTGIIHHQNAPRRDVPDEAKRATAIGARGGIYAAKKENGNWIAWGIPGMGVRDRIASIGPARVISFDANDSAKWGVLLWLE